MVKHDEEHMEEKVYRIWSVLSTFEESSAACISDMLLHVSNGAYVDGVLVAKKFIWHVDVLFGATDRLDLLMTSEGLKSKIHLPHLTDYGADLFRSGVWSRSKAVVQEDRRLLLSLDEDPRGRSEEAWRDAGASVARDWACTLSQTVDQDQPARGVEA